MIFSLLKNWWRNWIFRCTYFMRPSNTGCSEQSWRLKFDLRSLSTEWGSHNILCAHIYVSTIHYTRLIPINLIEMGFYTSIFLFTAGTELLILHWYFDNLVLFSSINGNFLDIEKELVRYVICFFLNVEFMSIHNQVILIIITFVEVNKNFVSWNKLLTYLFLFREYKK